MRRSAREAYDDITSFLDFIASSPYLRRLPWNKNGNNDALATHDMASVTASPTFSGHRRSVTAPVRAQPSLHDRGDAPEEPHETLFEHSKVNIYSFPIGGKIGSPYAGAKNPQVAGVLPYKSPTESIISLDRPLRLRRPKTGAPFLQGGTQAKEIRLPMMPNTVMWCIDGQSKFATNSGLSTCRIEFPFNDESDQQVVEAFKEALKKIIQYEPTEISCPFRRESKTNAPTQEELESPHRPPKRALIGKFEELSPSPSNGTPRKRQSESFGLTFTLQRGSSVGASDDDTGEGLTESEVVMGNDPSENVETCAENAEPQTEPGALVPSTFEASISSSVTAEYDYPGASRGQILSLLSTDEPHSNASSHAERLPEESSSSLSLDGSAPESLQVNRQHLLADCAIPSSSPPIEDAPTSEVVDLQSRDEEEIVDVADLPLTVAAQTPPASSDTTISAAASTASSPRSSPSPIDAPDVEPLPESSKDGVNESLDNRALPNSSSTQSLPEWQLAEPAPSEEPSSLGQPPEPARFTAAAADPSTSTVETATEVTTNSNRISSTADTNTYILSKLIDVLTSPPSKFFGFLVELLHLVSDRLLTVTTSQDGSGRGGGVTGRLRLPNTPGRWVDSEETSEADGHGEGGANADTNQDSDLASEDEWDSDDPRDDYGVPLRNDSPGRAGRRKWANGASRDIVATGTDA